MAFFAFKVRKLNPVVKIQKWIFVVFCIKTIGYYKVIFWLKLRFF